MRRFIVTIFYVGYVPVVSGTLASFLAALLAAVYYFVLSPSPWPLAALAAAMFFAGLGLGRWAIADLNSPDPRQFVLDEVCGQLIACLAAAPLFQFEPNLWQAFAAWIKLPTAAAPGLVLAAAFLLFRFFDIAKPPPVNLAERLPGGLGIMADDIVAGLLSGGLLVAAGALFAHLSA